jgi:PKHD-type hydroxylase
MIVTLEQLLAPELLDALRSQLRPEDFVDGKLTAGWHARLVKQNTQLAATAPYAETLRLKVEQALGAHPLFQSIAHPRYIHSLLFSRYETGMAYGSHVDNAWMGQSPSRRSDLSFTLFLSPPEDYVGGELVLELADGDRPYKLAAGSVVVYPSSYLHRVETVQSGTRLVVVGWVQSYIRDPAQREILFDLDTVRRSLFQQQGKILEFDLLSKSYANLLRQWGEG